MTESDWATSTDPQAMQSYLRGTDASDRKYRLFACACCRRIWDKFPDERNRDLVVAVENFPDANFEDPKIHGLACVSPALERQHHEVAAYWVAKALGLGFYKMPAAVSAQVVSAKVLYLAKHEDDIQLTTDERDYYRFRPTPLSPKWQAEAAAQATLLRDIFGNPFRQTAFDDTWRISTVLSLASQMYEASDFGLMEILGDALQDAGCADEAILEHCRLPAQHTRGCWLVDLVLRKS